jgi:hypothetical protein
MSIARSEEPNAALAAFGYHAGPRVGESIPVRSPVLTLGQGSRNDIVLADDTISTVHARLEYDAGQWRLTDLGSTNGTFVEGVRLSPNVPTPLAYGSVVRFGLVTLEFHPVETADPDAARAGYTPPPEPTPLAGRKGGFRLPLWLFLVIVIVLAALLFFVLQTPDAAAGAPAASPPRALAPPGSP